MGLVVLSAMGLAAVGCSDSSAPRPTPGCTPAPASPKPLLSVIAPPALLA